MIILQPILSSKEGISDFFEFESHNSARLGSYNIKNHKFVSLSFPISPYIYFLSSFVNETRNLIVGKIARILEKDYNDILSKNNFISLGLDIYVSVYIKRQNLRMILFNVDRKKICITYLKMYVNFSIVDLFEADLLSFDINFFYSSYEQGLSYTNNAVECFSHSSSFKNILKDQSSENIKKFFSILEHLTQKGHETKNQLCGKISHNMFLSVSVILYSLLLIAKNKKQDLETVKCFKSIDNNKEFFVSIKVFNE